MKKTQFVYTLLLLCFLVGGCVSTQNQGKMVRAGDVDQLIESATVLPDHIYYYTGPEARPDVIIAIDNSFTLTSKYWIKVDDVANRLKDWNRLIDNGHRASYRYEGFWLMTPDGRQAGIWYSPYDYTVVQFPDPSTIILYTPSTRDKSGRPSMGGRR
jgi:hypothetical protein